LAFHIDPVERHEDCAYEAGDGKYYKELTEAETCHLDDPAHHRSGDGAQSPYGEGPPRACRAEPRRVDLSGHHVEPGRGCADEETRGSPQDVEGVPGHDAEEPDRGAPEDEHGHEGLLPPEPVHEIAQKDR